MNSPSLITRLQAKVNTVIFGIAFVISSLITSSCVQDASAPSLDQMDFETVLSTIGDTQYLEGSYLTSTKESGVFTLSDDAKSPDILINMEDFEGVVRVANDLKTDLKRVAGNSVDIIYDSIPDRDEVIIIGTYGKSPLINKLVDTGKIDLSTLNGKWEQYVIETIDNPFDGIGKALVISGSDKRGTIFGVYDLSEKMGVSPWYWWADVPVKMYSNLFVKPGRFTDGEPKVKYRGIFINDEAPALSGWAEEKFGGFNHQFYEKVYELILRLKGNYLWPAMWGRSLFDDDSLSAPIANKYGVVLGTTHHEPLMRSHVEWNRYGKGPWNYEKNDDVLQEFWRDGMERMEDNESIVTLGMRGDGDEAMSESSNIALLQKIVSDQRNIIEEVTGKKAEETPQLWALYKEVQDYYNKGMRVPDDVTLLLCDDNWGNQRFLPRPGSAHRSGGYGIYYHFDFVGGPRNYKWLNTSPISRVWEQMNLAYRHNVDRIWLVNVGDLKPMELPISFFLDFAWNPDLISPEDISGYHKKWALQQFGEKYADEVAQILMKYTKFNSRRKPEMLAPDTYSLVNYHEAETVVNEYNALADKANKLYQDLPKELKSAYYQLVLFPVMACANLNELHVSTGLNHLYAEQGRVATNSMANQVKQLFDRDKRLSTYFHDSLANGKWNHIMSQTHISYTNWQQPDKDVLPELKHVNPQSKAEMGVAIEGSSHSWPGQQEQAVLPEMDVYQQQKRYFEIFNRGEVPFEFVIEATQPWLRISTSKGNIEEQQRIWAEVDWEDVPKGFHEVPIKVSGPDGQTVELIAKVRNQESPLRSEIDGYVEGSGYISMEAVHYTSKTVNDQLSWKLIPDLGRTGSSITTFPVATPRITPGDASPHLEYKINLHSTGNIKVKVYLAPILNIYLAEGLKYGVSIDDERPQVLNIHEGDTVPDWNYPDWWNNAVSQNIMIRESEHMISSPGQHILKFWAVDPGVALQKIVVVSEGIKPSYLGPPESYRN